MSFLKDKILVGRPNYGKFLDWLIVLIGNSIMTSDELDLCHLPIDDIYR
jgi:hypothetical protein